MTSRKGYIVLMGSGELTSTMVSVHKEMLDKTAGVTKAVFLDTPAGFQLNVDDISKKAQQYFNHHVQHPLSIASFKSAETATEFERETVYNQLRHADFYLIGPGSPTYTVSNLKQTHIPDIMIKQIESGACLTAASAAALTVGSSTLPVYEIYKVGHPLHWMEGLNILSHFGMNVVVIPHWNNAEGGTHDTRFCYMGEVRFKKLEALLPDDTIFVGLDEHTACILDLEAQMASIRGLGNVIIRQERRELAFDREETIPLEIFKKGIGNAPKSIDAKNDTDNSNQREENEDNFWKQIHHQEADFRQGLADQNDKKMISALLNLDSILWKAQSDLESEENVTQAREILRDLIVLLGVEMADRPASVEAVMGPLVSGLLKLRARYREEKRWVEADQLRDLLLQSGIVVEDTKQGQQWRMLEPQQ